MKDLKRPFPPSPPPPLHAAWVVEDPSPSPTASDAKAAKEEAEAEEVDQVEVALRKWVKEYVDKEVADGEGGEEDGWAEGKDGGLGGGREGGWVVFGWFYQNKLFLRCITVHTTRDFIFQGWGIGTCPQVSAIGHEFNIKKKGYFTCLGV